MNAVEANANGFNREFRIKYRPSGTPGWAVLVMLE